MTSSAGSRVLLKMKATERRSYDALAIIVVTLRLILRLKLFRVF